MQETQERPSITFPESLPVSAWVNEIRQALRKHQVIIVAGETGSGKTTQLPKICLAAGRGRKGMIGHTQPRRIAAISVAKRIAHELESEIGQCVGYQVRFNDKVSRNTQIKLMTDGILLAETQRDPLLKKYDTIIIDEAHERSLNIDFLLGFLKNLLPRRRDLKVIITSATIDAKRFAEHFSDRKGNTAKVFEVSGRLYPVEIQYAPINDPDDEDDESSDTDEEQDRLRALADAVHTCEAHGKGDILVFLPGEREIREAHNYLQSEEQNGLQILPLFARLSNKDQEKIFHPTTQLRRVILSTNVAETSLTVPGIRFVIDSGLARVKRYSWRNKVEQLQIEKISRAAANQRAGRCGRLGPGLCIRLYSEEDFQQRDEFTDPEILRSSLATVILRMKALRLQDIASFPFIDPPSGKAVADGYDLLQTLGALDNENRLTRSGKQLSKLPLDPRLGSMILASVRQQCLSEVLIIVSALSVADPRERPFDALEQSQQAHAKHKDKNSEFIVYLNMWRWYHEQQAQKESNRKFEQLLRKHYLSPRRMREWTDIYSQLLTLADDMKWRFNRKDATYEQLHKSLLSGLLDNIGLKSEQGNFYQGARGIKFLVHPSSIFHKKSGRWIMVADLVETTRLYGHCVAKIEPEWIEWVARDLIKKNWSDPHYSAKRGQVLIRERGSLYGLTIYQGRQVAYDRIDLPRAREMFIREALVAGEMQRPLPFLKANLKLVNEIEHMEHKARRQDILVDDELIYSFYNERIPHDIAKTASLAHWYKHLDDAQRKALVLDKDDLMRHEAAGITTEIFPKKLEINGVSLQLSYHFEPGSPKDGVTMSIPVFALQSITPEPPQWLVPGMIKEKVQQLLKSLPQRMRRHCVPLPDYADGFYKRHADPESHQQPLINALIDDIREQLGIRVATSDFKTENVAPHLLMIFKVVDEFGRMLSAGRNLAQLKAEYASEIQESFQEIATADSKVADVLEYDHIRDWTFGKLPELLEIKKGSQTLVGFPALVDQGADCRLDVFDDPDDAKRSHFKGLLRVFRIALKEQVKFTSKNLSELNNLSILYMPLGTREQLLEQIIECALIQACMQEPWPDDQPAFEQRVQEAKKRYGLIVREVVQATGRILNEWSIVNRRLQTVKAHTRSYEDIKSNVAQLVGPSFLTSAPFANLMQFPRYLKAAQMRIDKLKQDPDRDFSLMTDMQQLESKYRQRRSELKGRSDPALDEFAWLLQELRVSLFAQSLKTPMPVSVKRLTKQWHAMSH